MNFEERLRAATEANHNIGVCIRVEWQNKFLLLERSKDDFCSGIYEMPGGSIEKGETLEVAVKRELLEETGISLVDEIVTPIDIFEFENIETGKHKTKFAFSIVLDEKPDIILSPDHCNYFFLSRDEIEHLAREGRDAEYVLWKDHYEILIRE